MVVLTGAGDEKDSCWFFCEDPNLSVLVPADPNEAGEVCHFVTMVAGELWNVVQYSRENSTFCSGWGGIRVGHTRLLGLREVLREEKQVYKREDDEVE